MGIYQCKSSCTTEGKFASSDQCCAGLEWNPLTKECYNALKPNISVSPSWLVFEI